MSIAQTLGMDISSCGNLVKNCFPSVQFYEEKQKRKVNLTQQQRIKFGEGESLVNTTLIQLASSKPLLLRPDFIDSTPKEVFEKVATLALQLRTVTLEELRSSGAYIEMDSLSRRR
jgi:hypothetical protein